MKKITKENVSWLVFSLGCLVLLATSTGHLFRLPFVNNLLFTVVIPATVPIILLICHAYYTINVRRGLFLIVLAGLTGLLFEIIGLRYGTFFGGQYVYNVAVPLIFGVPYAVVIFWSFFIYSGYAITTSFLYWLHKDKPSKDNRQLFLLFLLVLIDGLIVTVIDLFMDPIQVKAGMWTWLQGGAYFGVPIGNFVGWFTVIVIVTAVFRLFEYFFPQKTVIKKKSFFLVPVIGYIILAFYYAANAVYLGLYSLAVLGLFLMLPVAIVNLFFYFKSLKNKV